LGALPLAHGFLPAPLVDDAVVKLDSREDHDGFSIESGLDKLIILLSFAAVQKVHAAVVEFFAFSIVAVGLVDGVIGRRCRIAILFLLALLPQLLPLIFHGCFLNFFAVFAASLPIVVTFVFGGRVIFMLVKDVLILEVVFYLFLVLAVYFLSGSFDSGARSHANTHVEYKPYKNGIFSI
jgi:hypothetical protein